MSTKTLALVVATTLGAMPALPAAPAAAAMALPQHQAGDVLQMSNAARQQILERSNLRNAAVAASDLDGGLEITPVRAFVQESGPSFVQKIRRPFVQENGPTFVQSRPRTMQTAPGAPGAGSVTGIYGNMLRR